MKPAVFHDLKTERADVGQPLPAALRILPVLFFGSIIAAIGLSTYCFLQMKAAQEKESTARAEDQNEQAEIAKLGKETEAINAETNNARQVQTWLLGTNQLQPIVLGICRAIDVDSSMSQLTLARREELPAQIQLSMQVTSPKGPRQVETIRTRLQDVLGYRTFSENIENNSKSTDFNFNCVLVHSEGPEAGLAP